MFSWNGRIGRFRRIFSQSIQTIVGNSNIYFSRTEKSGDSDFRFSQQWNREIQTWLFPKWRNREIQTFGFPNGKIGKSRRIFFQTVKSGNPDVYFSNGEIGKSRRIFFQTVKSGNSDVYFSKRWNREIQTYIFPNDSDGPYSKSLLFRHSDVRLRFRQFERNTKTLTVTGEVFDFRTSRSRKKIF